jgi:hypothetical protein
MTETCQNKIEQTRQKPNLLNCPDCGTRYQITLLKSGENYNDFGMKFCPWCGDLTQGLPDPKATAAISPQNIYVLITLSGGIINQAEFFVKARPALEALSEFVRKMHLEDQDAAIFNLDGYYANAKDFLDEDDKIIENPDIMSKS